MGQPYLQIAGPVQNVSYTGTAGVTTNAVGKPFARIASTTACYISFGTAPTATSANGHLINPGVGEIFKMNSIDYKVSGIQVASGGVLSVTPMDG